MRNYVQKVFVGKGIAYKAPFDVDGNITLAEDEVMAFDWDTKEAVTATTGLVGFHLGLDQGIVTGPVNTKLRMNNLKTAYTAQVAQAVTVTVTAIPLPYTEVLFRVLVHDNLSIVPNQMKQIFASVIVDDVDTIDTFAAKVRENLTVAMKRRNFGTISGAGAEIIVTSNVDLAYNQINRPEVIYIEVGVPANGAYTLTETLGVHPSGEAEQVMWLEDLNAGRYGFSDRTNWNAKKYQHQAIAGTTYDIFSVNANIDVEGDMQDIRFNPVGILMALEVGASDPLITEIAPVMGFKDITSV